MNTTYYNTGPSTVCSCMYLCYTQPSHNTQLTVELELNK